MGSLVAADFARGRWSWGAGRRPLATWPTLTLLPKGRMAPLGPAACRRRFSRDSPCATLERPVLGSTLLFVFRHGHGRRFSCSDTDTDSWADPPLRATAHRPLTGWANCSPAGRRGPTARGTAPNRIGHRLLSRLPRPAQQRPGVPGVVRAPARRAALAPATDRIRARRPCSSATTTSSATSTPRRRSTTSARSSSPAAARG